MRLLWYRSKLTRLFRLPSSFGIGPTSSFMYSSLYREHKRNISIVSINFLNHVEFNASIPLLSIRSQVHQMVGEVNAVMILMAVLD